MSTFQTRPSGQQSLDRFLELSEDEAARQRLQEIEQLQQDFDAAQTFRPYAPSTIARQDHHLSLYRGFVMAYLKNVDDTTLSEVEVNAVLFPSDQRALRHQMSLFMAWVFKNVSPRARAAKTITVQQLSQYRNSMMYWARYHYHRREQQLQTKLLHDAMVKQIVYIQSKYGDPATKKAKTWLGLAELRQLLDHESINNHSIEVSEQHQVLWCLGRLTALRPGSLVPSGSGKYSRSSPISWKSFTFTRGEEPGKFNLRITLDHINIKRAENAIAALKDAPMESPVDFNIQSPEPHNLIFSPAHRLLIIALRRGILEGIATLNELLDGDRHQISIKATALNDPIFYASIPKGTAIDTNRPLNGAGVTSYLRSRGYQIGYTAPITFYSLRRRAATDMVRRIGLAATRIFMGHDPHSQTLERYYLNMMATLDLMGILTEQGIQAGGHLPGSADWAPLALGRLTDAAFIRSRGLALRNMTERLIMADPSPPGNDATAKDLTNYQRRARHYARQLLVKQEAEWQRKHMTAADMAERKAGLSASTFANEALKRAADAGQDLNAIDDDDDSEWDGFDDDDLPEDEEDEFQEAEPDMEETLNQSVSVDKTGVIDLPFDKEVDIGASTGAHDIAYIHLAKSTMELLLDNSLSSHVLWSDMDRTCHLCREDETVSAKQKAIEFSSAANLDRHITYFHTPYKAWIRNIKTRSVGEAGKFLCPYCEEAGVDSARSYKRICDLVRHIQASDLETAGRAHDELKTAAGWYDEEFLTSMPVGPRPEVLQNNRTIAKRRLADIGIEFVSGRVLLEGEPHEKIPGLMRGPPPSVGDLVERHPNLLGCGKPPELGVIPPHLKDQLAHGYGPPFGPLSYEDAKLLMKSKYPRTADWDPKAAK